MPNQKATELARNILDDLRGATYYADPEMLGELLQSYVGTKQSKKAAVEILRYLLHKYANPGASDKDIGQLAEQLENHGVK
jgi:hypothetical protein